MCGISGLWEVSRRSAEDREAIGRAMSRALIRRGPDAEGIWSDPDSGLVLSHRRLAVLDPSIEGAQPMLSRSGRYVLVYNGEIYNHRAIRRHLDATGTDQGWRGHSDTETLLAAIDTWGLKRALDATSGMYALALWDRAQQKLFLARDRMGEKPLYYGHVASALVFASELKAFRAVPGFAPDLDQGALAAYLSVGYVPEGQSIYSGLTKVRPGEILQFEAPTGPAASIRIAGGVEDCIDAGSAARARHGDLGSASVELERVLRNVVASQMISDVPLGSFLSGGIDSSLVTAMMQSVSERPVLSFSIGFGEAAFDESAHAAAVARHLGTEHTEIRLAEADALDLIPELCRIYDEPFADSSQIPTALLCREARRAVTVALTGDGGDEVFGGYNRYLFAPGAWDRARRFPKPIRRRFGLLASVLHSLGGADNACLRRAMTRAGLPATTLQKIASLGDALGASESLPDLYHALTRIGPGAALLRDGMPEEDGDQDISSVIDRLEPAEWMMAMDSLTYLPGDVLVKVDRAAMAFSLETRAPLLDRRIVEAAWSLPDGARVEGRRGKRVLREILDRHVPRELVERPKQGFAIPLDKWLRSELRPWAEALLADDRLEAQGILEPEAVRNLWNAHISGKRNAGSGLWTVLMLVAWIENEGTLGPGTCRIAA